MTEPRPFVWSVRRGAMAAVVGACLAAAVVCLLVVWNAYRDDMFRRPAMIRSFGELWTRYEEWIFPLVGSAAVAAGTGWAAFAPRGRYRIASTLAIVTVGSLAAWFLLSFLELTPTRYKSEQHPVIYPSEALLGTVPPLVVGVVLSVVRAVRSRGLSSRPAAAPFADDGPTGTEGPSAPDPSRC